MAQFLRFGPASPGSGRDPAKPGAAPLPPDEWVRKMQEINLTTVERNTVEIERGITTTKFLSRQIGTPLLVKNLAVKMIEITMVETGETAEYRLTHLSDDPEGR